MSVLTRKKTAPAINTEQAEREQLIAALEAATPATKLGRRLKTLRLKMLREGQKLRSLDEINRSLGRARDADLIPSKFMSELPYDYGECHVCGEPMQEQQIKQDFWINGNLIVIEDVPAGVCLQCGEKIVNAATGQQIAALLADKQSVQDARKISVPIISLLKKVA